MAGPMTTNLAIWRIAGILACVDPVRKGAKITQLKRLMATIGPIPMTTTIRVAI